MPKDSIKGCRGGDDKSIANGDIHREERAETLTPGEHFFGVRVNCRAYNCFSNAQFSYLLLGSLNAAVTCLGQVNFLSVFLFQKHFLEFSDGAVSVERVERICNRSESFEPAPVGTLVELWLGDCEQM
jgi:hypothetical protein